jgi:hypothetical protein
VLLILIIPIMNIFQIGWVTLDNASNNDTLMVTLERELRRRKIPFDRTKQRVRYVTF